MNSSCSIILIYKIKPIHESFNSNKLVINLLVNIVLMSSPPPFSWLAVSPPVYNKYTLVINEILNHDLT